MAIGYEQAKRLMKQLDWKLLVVMLGNDRVTVNHLELYHPREQNRYSVRLDSGRKLMKECRVCGRKNDDTAILCYDHDGANEDLI